MGQPARKRDWDTMVVATGDFEFFAQYFLKIKDKDGGIVPLLLNTAQEYLHKLIELQLQHQGRVRVLGLKGRQQGFSTYTEGRFYWNSWRTTGKNAFILTHEDDATQNLFAMVDRYHKHIPEEYRLTTGKSNAKELFFTHKDAGYRVGTARTRGTGRSQTIHFLHWSEVAHSANQSEHVAGLLQTIPATDGTEIILETTANGVGELFHQLWQKAWEVLERDYSGDIEKMAREYDGYLPVFVPWYWQEEYRAKVPPIFERTEAEEALAKRFDLDDAQLQWRRKKIEEFDATPKFQGRGDIFFQQEYPNTPREAFLFSGDTFFPPESLARVEEGVSQPVAKGVLEQAGEKVRFIEQSNGWLEIWEWPDPKSDYVIGVDVADGLPHGDLNSGHVLKRDVLAPQVARFSPLVDPDDLGRYVVLVAKYYTGRAWIGIERNNMGVAAVIAAMDTGYPYLFQMPTAEASDDVRDGHRFGWVTNRSSRPVMLADLLSAVRDGSIKVHSPTTLDQMCSFIRKGAAGKPQGAEGCKDDDVMGLAVAYQMLQRTEAIPDVETSGLRAPRRHRGGWMG